MADYQEAAVEAQADEFITRLDNGYDTVIGERGVTLSGGERQRLAIARALLTNPQILVLDDSTSAIDSATEDKIQQAIFRAAKGRTTLIITHRLSQIRWADLILVLRNGRLTDSGTHNELLQASKAYRSLFRE
jgi:ATP-binding cassette subfamily B protein